MRLTGIAALAAAGVFAASAVASAAPSPLPLLRPPGAGAPEHFAARCVRCGRCLEACPYQAIHAAPLNAGRDGSTPYVNARAQACRLCVEFPCAAACPTGALDVPVAVMETAGEGGPWGMALLAAYRVRRAEGQTLEEYLADTVFRGAQGSVQQPDAADTAGFLTDYKSGLAVEKAAAAALR